MGYPKWTPHTVTQNARGESLWEREIPTHVNTHGTHEESPWKSSQGVGNPHGTTIPSGTLETHTGGRAEMSHGRFVVDLGIFAWVEQALDTAENCSTPCPRAGIRTCHFCVGRIPSLKPGVERVFAGRWGGWLDPHKNAWGEVLPDSEILAGMV